MPGNSIHMRGAETQSPGKLRWIAWTSYLMLAWPKHLPSLSRVHRENHADLSQWNEPERHFNGNLSCPMAWLYREVLDSKTPCARCQDAEATSLFSLGLKRNYMNLDGGDFGER